MGRVGDLLKVDTRNLPVRRHSSLSNFTKLRWRFKIGVSDLSQMPFENLGVWSINQPPTAANRHRLEF